MQTHHQLHYTDYIKKILLNLFFVFYMFHLYSMLWRIEIFANIDSIATIIYKFFYVFILGIHDTAFDLLLGLFTQYPDFEILFSLVFSILLFISIIEMVMKHETKLELYIVDEKL